MKAFFTERFYANMDYVNELYYNVLPSKCRFTELLFFFLEKKILVFPTFVFLDDIILVGKFKENTNRV